MIIYCIQYGSHIQKLCPFRSHISFCFPYRPYPSKATMSMEPEHHRTPPSSAKPSSPCTARHAIFGQVDSFWLGPSRGNPGIQNSVFNYMIYKMIYEFHENKTPHMLIMWWNCPATERCFSYFLPALKESNIIKQPKRCFKTNENRKNGISSHQHPTWPSASFSTVLGGSSQEPWYITSPFLTWFIASPQCDGWADRICKIWMWNTTSHHTN